MHVEYLVEMLHGIEGIWLEGLLYGNYGILLCIILCVAPYHIDLLPEIMNGRVKEDMYYSMQCI
jgi:hypothetical protein